VIITYVKANQTTLQYGSGGGGSASHTACVLLNSLIGVSITHVPYRGAAPAMQNLVGGDQCLDLVPIGLLAHVEPEHRAHSLTDPFRRLAVPGGNVTGTTVLNPELMAKRLELLKEIVPAMTHAAVLLNPGNAANGPVRQAMEMAAKALQVGLQPFELQSSGDLDRVFAAMADSKIDALVVHDPVGAGREPGAARRQRHRFYRPRLWILREMGGTAQRDRARRYAGSGAPGNGWNCSKRSRQALRG
jgi:hypothetical protein